MLTHEFASFAQCGDYGVTAEGPTTCVATVPGGEIRFSIRHDVDGLRSISRAQR